MFQRRSPFVFTTVLALGALLHCKGSNPQPSNTPSGSMQGDDGSSASAIDESTTGESSSGTQSSNGSSNGDRAGSSASSPNGEASSPTGPGATASAGSSTDNRPGAARSGSSSRSLSDPQIAAITDAANTAEVEQGRLAQSKASDSRVRQFAALMVDHHAEARRDQQTLSVSKRDNPDSQRIANEAEAALESLRSKSGPEFDRVYIQLQRDEHRKVLDTIERELLPAAKDPGLRAYLQRMKPKVEAHLAQAEQLQRALASNDESSQNEQRTKERVRSSDKPRAVPPRALNR